MEKSPMPRPVTGAVLAILCSNPLRYRAKRGVMTLRQSVTGRGPAPSTAALACRKIE
jgi:hypothetical protein